MTTNFAREFARNLPIAQNDDAAGGAPAGVGAQQQRYTEPNGDKTDEQESGEVNENEPGLGIMGQESESELQQRKSGNP